MQTVIIVSNPPQKKKKTTENALTSTRKKLIAKISFQTMNEATRKEQISSEIENATTVEALTHLFHSIADLDDMKAYFKQRIQNLTHFPISSINNFTTISVASVKISLTYLSYDELTKIATVSQQFNDISRQLRTSIIKAIIPNESEFDMMQIIDANRYPGGLSSFEKSLGFNRYDQDLNDYSAMRKGCNNMVSLLFSIPNRSDRSDLVNLHQINHTIICYQPIKFDESIIDVQLNRLMMANVKFFSTFYLKNQRQILIGKQSLILKNCKFRGDVIDIECAGKCLVENCHFLGPVIIRAGGHYQFRNCIFSREFDAENRSENDSPMPSPITIPRNSSEIKIEECEFYYTCPWPPILLTQQATTDCFKLANNKSREQIIKRLDSGCSYKYANHKNVNIVHITDCSI
eukprot:107192_1